MFRIPGTAQPYMGSALTLNCGLSGSADQVLPLPSGGTIPEDHLTRVQRIDGNRYLIDGQVRSWAGAATTINAVALAPDGSAQPIGSSPRLTAAQSVEALEAAEGAYDRGQGKWPQLSIEQRCQVMERCLKRMQQHRESVVSALILEIGKTPDKAADEFDRTIVYMRETIAAARKIDADSRESKIVENTEVFLGRGPVGPLLCMGPFNYPLNETLTIVLPAVLMGNPVIFKTPKIGELGLLALLDVFAEEFPPGVIQCISGDGREVISPIVSSGKLSGLAFIGSTQVADILLHQNPPAHKLRTLLGLGAKNPAVIMPDADLDAAVSECCAGALGFNGQRCTALKMIFVHESIADDFLARLCNKVSSLKAGMPWEKVSITPLPEPGKVQDMNKLLEDATGLGARIINPGGGESRGNLMRPAVVYPVTSEMQLWHKEQFGPIVPVASYRDLSEVYDYLASSPLKQQVSLFGRDTEELWEHAERLTRMPVRININAQCQRGPDSLPFTGRESSALGTVSITDALEAFSVPTIIARKTAR